MAAPLSRLALAGLLVSLVACTAVQTVPDTGELALLEIDCQPPDAEIWVDGRFLGAITEWRGGIVPLSPGEHRVKITADGYYAYRMDIQAVQGRSYKLALDLVADLESEDASLDAEESR